MQGIEKFYLFILQVKIITTKKIYKQSWLAYSDMMHLKVEIYSAGQYTLGHENNQNLDREIRHKVLSSKLRG